MNKSPKSKTRLAAACICLLAILLMYAPLLGASVMAVTGSCCTGGQCPIHGNHHSPIENQNTPMDCGHEFHNLGTVDSCSMSCCHNVEQTAIHVHAFVLTSLKISTSLAPFPVVLRSVTPAQISPKFAPLAPPPKSSVL
ncbi:MAG TPA: hypothetical protein VIW23_06105 [Candidatus Acidoferrum sp.]|jgi:hypothetical protein